MAKSFALKSPMATANAAGATTAIVFVACRLLVGVFPDFMFTVGQSWLHGIQLTQMGTWNVPGSTFILGLVSSTVFAWLVGYLFAVLYNTFIEK
jgi:hypothetical protein